MCRRRRPVQIVRLRRTPKLLSPIFTLHSSLSTGIRCLYGLVSALQLAPYRRHLDGGRIFSGDPGGVLHRKAAPAGEGRAGCGADTAPGAAPHGGGVAAAGAAGAQPPHRRLGAGPLRPEAGDDLVVRCLCHGGGGLPPDVPYRPGGL